MRSSRSPHATVAGEMFSMTLRWPPLLDPSGQRCGIEGGGEGVALTDIAAAFMQSGPTCHRLDAFGHYLHIEFVPELHACAHHACHIAITLAITYEQFVDFQLAERHTGKRRK